MNRMVGQVLVGAGAALLVLGALTWWGALSWFGRLPGDIRVERPGLRVYAPLASMLLVSLLLTALVALVRRFWR